MTISKIACRMLLAGVMTLSGFAADKNKDHNDAFVPGEAGKLISRRKYAISL